MKKIIVLPLALAALFFSSCNGTKEYDRYVDDLTRQLTQINNVETPEEYAARLDSVQAISAAFEQSGIKLNPDQQAQIQDLNIRLQEAFTKTYERLASTPMILPDSVPVPE